MLRELFDGTGGVTSALDHAKIEGANNPEALSVDAQAAKVARRAAEALRQSRAACQVRPTIALSLSTHPADFDFLAPLLSAGLPSAA